MLQQRSTAPSYDVIVVGARCAGSPLATLLCRRGLRVCLLDRARFPSDSPSTHGIQPPGVKVLAELGVLDRLLAVAPAIDDGVIALEDFRVDYAGLTATLGAPMVNVRRITLDAILVEAATAAGAELRTGVTVTGLLRSAGRVVGVETTAGPLHAGLVVGADGARSTVARLVAAPEYHRTAPRRAFLWSYFEGVAADERRVWIGSIGENGFLASPTDSGLFLAALVAPIERREELRSDRIRAYEEGIAGWPELGATVARGRRVGPVQLMSRWHGFFRQSAGPGWALVGDAGHFKDPTPGQGISDALHQVTTLAPTIVRSLDGGDDDPLRAWWRWRDRESWEMYWFAQQMADSTWAPLLSETVNERFAADPELVNRMVRILSRDLAASKLLTPVETASVVAETLRRNPGRRLAVAREVGGLVGEELQLLGARALLARKPAGSQKPAG
ncbi:MAG TPA: NAD(P)/FAD-dependent oxidoreductase [Solirubrobacterales bacterium]|nr:NAD(P)/FAD-dependent oxidoreductase [Solirubrobacterales bacterium]